MMSSIITYVIYAIESNYYIRDEIFFFLQKNWTLFYFIFPLPILWILHIISNKFYIHRPTAMFKKSAYFLFIIIFFFNLLILYVLDSKIRWFMATFFFNHVIDTYYINLYMYFNINSLSLLLVILNNMILILCIIWSYNYRWNVHNLFYFFFFFRFFIKMLFFFLWYFYFFYLFWKYFDKYFILYRCFRVK